MDLHSQSHPEAANSLYKTTEPYRRLRRRQQREQWVAASWIDGWMDQMDSLW